MSLKEVFNKRPLLRNIFLILSALGLLFTMMLVVFEIQENFIIPMSILYIITTISSFVLLVCYCTLIKKKDLWLLLLYTSVFIVNLGYLSLSISLTISEALLANRIAYLGSVFLPLCMLMMVIELCHLKNRKRYTIILSLISCIMFFIAASGGYSNLYYESVWLVFVDGSATLEKVYGPLHSLYFVYLGAYFSLMVFLIIYSRFKKNSISTKQASFLTIATLGNVLLWLFEQVVPLHFEYLAISYLFSEMLILFLFMVDEEAQKQHIDTSILWMKESKIIEMMEAFSGYKCLTKREQEVLKYILLNKKRKEIAGLLHVTEHTIKKHTSNIFDKLNVQSRNELYDRIKEEYHA